MRKSEVKKYYDNYITEQYSIGVNDRIFMLYEKLKSLGLNSSSDVIELGCGIGVVTHLIRKTVTLGQIESVDISGESIEFAKEKIKNSNVSFYEGDVTEYIPKIKQADFVTLFDVIEHIREYEQSEFGEVSTDFSNAERVVNMYTYIIGEEIVCMIHSKYFILN